MENADNPEQDRESSVTTSNGSDTAASGSPAEANEHAPRQEDFSAQIQDLKKQLHDQTLRAAADLDNFRKRSRKDMEEAQRRVREDTLRELLPVFDNLERAIGAAKGASDMDAVVQGLQMVLRLFEDVGQRFQLERIRAVGEPFDPNVHEAIQQVETAEHPEGTVVAEFIPGYRLGGRLVRAAGVAVARKPAEPAASSESTDPTAGSQ